MDALYHYCSTKSFVAIAQSRSIWLSAIRLGNDALEGRLVSKTIGLLMAQEKLDQVKQNAIREIVDQLEESLDALCFCLSEKRDWLGQWRGYADNATGVAIGFSVDYLTKLSEANSLRVTQNLLHDKKPSFTLGKVRYSLQERIEAVKPAYLVLVKLFESGGLKKYSNMDASSAAQYLDQIVKDPSKMDEGHKALMEQVFLLYSNLFFLKHGAFEEEVEWRLMSPHVNLNVEQECSYRDQGDHIIPYRAYELNLPDKLPINEVILGPKHATPQHVVESFLRENGFGDVRVSQSTASYR